MEKIKSEAKLQKYSLLTSYLGAFDPVLGLLMRWPETTCSSGKPWTSHLEQNEGGGSIHHDAADCGVEAGRAATDTCGRD